MTVNEAINVLELHNPFLGTDKNLTEAFDIAIKALTAQRWIPCSERLPEVHETGNSFSGVYMQSYPVLVYGVPEGEEECGFHVVTYCDDLNGYTYWSTELDAVTIDGVKAWKPLPEPWREKSMDERTYETCRYSNRTWDLEPCDSCTIGGETSHWKPLEEPWKGEQP